MLCINWNKVDLYINVEKKPDRQILFFFINIKMFNHNRKWATSSSSYYLELVYIYSIDHRYRIKKSCHCYNVLIRKATNIGSSLSWDSTLRYKCEQSSHLSFSLSFSLRFVVSPKDSFRFNLFHLNRRNRQTDSVPSENWSSLMVIRRVCAYSLHTKEKTKLCCFKQISYSYTMCNRSITNDRVACACYHKFCSFSLYVSSSVFFLSIIIASRVFIYLFEVRQY
jgi:hypothetical protein